MSKRLHILVGEDDFEAIREAAEARRMTVVEWVRTAMRNVHRQELEMLAERKLAAVRDAAKHQFPASDVERMLAEIEQGYVVDTAR